MEATLRIVFLTPDGDQAARIFTECPLGLTFRSKLPIVIKRVQDGSHAAQLGVKVGWAMQSINGQNLVGMTLLQAYNKFVCSSAPLRQCMLVRTAPLDAVRVETLSTKLKGLEEIEVVPFLKQHGFQAESPASWGNNFPHPNLQFEVHGHCKMGRFRPHTWYMIVGTVITGEASSMRRWAVKRRLEHVRVLLHDPIKQELGNEYDRHFQNARFARHGGPPGTTARMQLWFAALSQAILAGAVVPALVASILKFLEAPLLPEHALIHAFACPTVVTDQNTDNVVESGAEANRREAPGDENSPSPLDGFELDEPKAENHLWQKAGLLKSGVDDALDLANNEEAPCGVVTRSGVEDEEPPCEVVTDVEDDLDLGSSEEVLSDVLTVSAVEDEFFESDNEAPCDVITMTDMTDAALTARWSRRTVLQRH
mmetsp:Transcript_69437/g.137292  ORF Transcript_69437/g.137292 Transcript_69437/m.137292 type:complete len:425 (+) Transcript_69437:62-1336(+)